jgi:hypothetical protein
MGYSEATKTRLREQRASQKRYREEVRALMGVLAPKVRTMTYAQFANAQRHIREEENRLYEELNRLSVSGAAVKELWRAQHPHEGEDDDEDWD